MKHEDQDSLVQQPTEGKQAWEEPKLSYVQPKLTTHGEMRELTGFVGTFLAGTS